MSNATEPKAETDAPADAAVAARPTAWQRLKRAGVRLVLLIGVPAAAVVAAGAIWISGGRYVETQNAYVKADIAHVASELDGRIRTVHVRDHERVKAGDLLLSLDAAPFEMALARSEAEIETARQEIAAREAALDEANSELREAEGRLAYLKRQIDRQRRLAKRGIVASTKLEEAREDLRQAQDRVAVMRQKVARAKVALGGRSGRDADLHPLVREKLVARDEARLNLERTRIRASVAGQVVSLRLQSGEHIESAKPLMAIVSASAPWIEANFKETELTHIREGMRATIALDIYPDTTWEAEVASISPATGAEFALLPPQNASGNWVKVVQRLPVKLRLTGDSPELPLRAGMTATVSVDTRRERSFADLVGPWGEVADRYARAWLGPLMASAPISPAEASQN
ncbi:MAG: HlyD family secretion protein [Pseudomonadota bacterium]